MATKEMLNFYLTGLIKKRALIANIVIGAVMLMANLGCEKQVEPNLPAPEPAPTSLPAPAPKPKPGGQAPIISLTPYPRGWVPGSDGWIPPLPPGMDKPRPLTKEEWDKVIEIASTDPEVARQAANNNIRAREFWWVAYAGGPGVYADSDDAIIGGADSAIMSGKARLPTIECWYYPAIRFESPGTDHLGDYLGRLVAVDLATGKIVLSEGWGRTVPSR